MNEELQRGILGDFLNQDIDLSKLRSLAHQYRLDARHFTDPALQTAYTIISTSESSDRLLLAGELAKKLGADTVEGLIARASVSIVDAEARIRRLVDDCTLAEAREITERTMRELNGKASARFILSGICRELSALADRSGVSLQEAGFSLADLADPIPEEENPNALIRGGWMRKGFGSVLASVTGSGKSVISTQLAYAWGVGKSIFGLSPVRPLRIGIFQTEDDKDELTCFREWMRKGFSTISAWSEEEIVMAEKNVIFHDTQRMVGRHFFELLESIQRTKKHDLIIINPLQGVCGCNLSDNNEMRVLLTEIIDPIIKSPATSCGLMIVHHTNKPTIHNGQQGFGGDQYAEYLGAGAGVLSNWMRAMLAVMPTKEDGKYHLIAAKRGKRLGWPKREDLKCTKPTRVICHAPDEMEIGFWLEDTSVQSTEGSKSGLDSAADAKRLASDLRRLPRTLTEARKYAIELFGKSKRRNEIAYEMLMKHPDAFGLVVRPVGIGTLSVIGSPEGVENEISALREKQAQKMLAKVKEK